MKRNGPAFVPQPRDYGLARAGKPAEKGTRLAVSSLPKVCLAPKAQRHRQPGATPQETGVQNSASAESAFQGDGELISHLSFGESDESRFQRYRFQIDFPGAMPQAEIKAAPLALNRYFPQGDIGARKVTRNRSEER
jgi:hypothetical protein